MTHTKPLTPAITSMEALDALAIRASAHSAGSTVLRSAQKFQNGVTDLDVSRVMLTIERGVQPYRNNAGRWSVQRGTSLRGMPSYKLSTVIQEMIRTGLVRHLQPSQVGHDVLVPAPVHFRQVHPDASQTSACLFVGEDMGPMRSRLVDRLDLVDCLACEAAISTGTVRGL